MERKYSVARQEVRLLSKEKIASDQIAFVRCAFSFDSAWDDIVTKIAQFAQHNSETIEQVLDEFGECDLPHEIVPGWVNVSVYGVKPDGTRATTIPVRDYVSKSGYSENGSPSKTLTPELFEQLIQRVEQAAENGAGIGFYGWSYDDSGHLHIYNKKGEDAIPPLYVPGIDNSLVQEEDLELARTLVAVAQKAAADAEERATKAQESADESLTHDENAKNSAKEAELHAYTAMAAAKETKEYAEAAEALKKLGELEDLTDKAEQAKLYAKSAELYALESAESAKESIELHERFEQHVSDAENNIESLAISTAESAEKAKNAAEHAEQAVEGLTEAAEKAANEAVETIRQESGGIIEATNDALEKAQAAIKTAESASEEARENAEEAAESERNAALSAEQAKQVAEKNGYFYFTVRNGRLIETRTDNVADDITFEINEKGRLIAKYGESE